MQVKIHNLPDNIIDIRSLEGMVEKIGKGVCVCVCVP